MTGLVFSNLLFATLGLATGAMGVWFLREHSLRTEDELGVAEKPLQGQTRGAAEHAVDDRTVRLVLIDGESRLPGSDPDEPESALLERRTGSSRCSPPTNTPQPLHRSLRDASRPPAKGSLASSNLDQGGPVAPCGRKTFLQVVEHRLAELRRNGFRWSIVLARLDNYQSICDGHGPHAGSIAFQAVARYFLANVRKTDWVARFDATTFAILLPGANLEDAQGVAERLHSGVARASLFVDGRPLEVSIVTGTAEASLGDDSDALLHRAETTLAKVPLEESLALCHSP